MLVAQMPRVMDLAVQLENYKITYNNDSSIDYIISQAYRSELIV